MGGPYDGEYDEDDNDDDGWEAQNIVGISHSPMTEFWINVKRKNW